MLFPCAPHSSRPRSYPLLCVYFNTKTRVGVLALLWKYFKREKEKEREIASFARLAPTVSHHIKIYLEPYIFAQCPSVRLFVCPSATKSFNSLNLHISGFWLG